VEGEFCCNRGDRLMSIIYHYTPSKMSPHQLKQMFVSKKGQSILDRIVTDLEKRANKSSNQHYLILGPRGIGKSHLLANLYYMIKETQSLNSHWIPLWFSEEEYSVISIRDFVDRILEEISTVLPGENDKVIDEIEEFKRAMVLNTDDEEVFKLTGAFIKDLSKRLNKRFVVIFENFNMFLKDISSYEEKKLRSLLMNETFLLFIVSAPTLHSYLKEVADPQNALYNLFDVHYLSELSFEESQELLKQQCLWDNNIELCGVLEKEKNKLKLIHRFAGGTPRLMLMFYQLTDSLQNLPDAERAFDELLEELTPYFQSRTGALSSQQKKILITFTQSMENLTPAEVGKIIHLPTNQVTAQIKKLVEHGFLGIVAKEGQKRGTLYELSERIYRYWYQSRTSMGREWIAGLVEFISNWFSMDELKRFKIEWEKKFQISFDKEEKKCAQKRLDYVNNSIKIKEDKFWDYLSKVDELFESGMFKEAVELLDKALEITQTYDAFYTKGLLLWWLDKFEDAIKCYDKAIKMKPDYVPAYINKGAALISLGKYEDAIIIHDKAIEIWPASPIAYYNKATALTYAGRLKEAILCYNEVIKFNPDKFEIYFEISICQLKLNQNTEAQFNFEKGLTLLFTQKNKIELASFITYFYFVLKTREYDFAKTVINTVIKRISDLNKGHVKKLNFESLSYFVTLIKFLKTGDKNLLDRQPFEIRQTLKEMAEYISLSNPSKPAKIKK
jgi:tetratricopeptide (TPR) repeat protein